MALGVTICFTGMDGSGKTSLVFNLMNELEKRGIDCEYVWARWFPGLADPFHFVVRKTLGPSLKTYRFYEPIRLVYQTLVLFDHVVPVFFRVKLPVKMGRCVMIDRYVYDRIADLCFAGFDFSPNSLFARLFVAMAAQPNIIFWIDVPPETSLQRKRDLSYSDAVSYRKIYASLAETYGFQRIENLDFSFASNRILEKTLELLKRLPVLRGLNQN